MRFTPKYTPEQWAEARRLRAEGLEFSAIAKRLGFGHPRSVSSRAKKEGWADTPQAAKAATPRNTPARRPSPAAAETLRALAQRLYRLIDLDIRKLEIRMQKDLEEHKHAPPGAKPPAISREDCDSFATIIERINLVTEIASEPASAVAGGRKFTAVNPELTALSDDIDPAGLAAASEKDEQRAHLAEQLAKAVGPA